jgi:hypothetical protein
MDAGTPGLSGYEPRFRGLKAKQGLAQGRALYALHGTARRNLGQFSSLVGMTKIDQPSILKKWNVLARCCILIPEL